MEIRTLVTLLLASVLYCARAQQESCTSPTGVAGKCVVINNCPPMLELVRKANRTAEETNAMRSAHCGFEGNLPKVCCADVQPRSLDTNPVCFTPDAQQGRCVSSASCQHLTALLEEPNAEKDAFIKNSKCDIGIDNTGVCCGSQPPNLKPSLTCTSTLAPPYPGSKCCGHDSSASDKIVGGADTGIDEYPWMALIEYIGKRDNQIKLLCGGSLISGRYVLTAGHCVVGRVLAVGTPRSVRLGEYNTSNELSAPDCVKIAGDEDDCTTGAVSITIEKITPHAEYNPQSSLIRHDIALLRLARMAPYNDFIKPICLPQTDVTASLLSGITFSVAGWGAVNTTHSKSEVKQYVDVPFVNIQTCQPSYNVSGRKVQQLWQGQICAGGERDKDSCRGDSGGPLMHKSGRLEVVGVVSFGPTPCGLENIPGVYTKVHEYLPWIRKNITP